MNSVPVAKFGSRSSSDLKNDALPTVAVCTRKNAKLSAATIASMRISYEPNQSSCSPRSSIAWNAPIASASVAKPNASNFTCGRGARAGRKVITPASANAPIGTLMKNTQRQL